MTAIPKQVKKLLDAWDRLHAVFLCALIGVVVIGIFVLGVFLGAWAF